MSRPNENSFIYLLVAFMGWLLVTVAACSIFFGFIASGDTNTKTAMVAGGALGVLLGVLIVRRADTNIFRALLNLWIVWIP